MLNKIKNIISKAFICFITFFVCIQVQAMHCNYIQEEQVHYSANLNNIHLNAYHVLNEIHHAKQNNYAHVRYWTRNGTDYVSYNGGLHYYSTKPWHNREGRLPNLSTEHTWWQGNLVRREFYVEHDIVPYYQGINRGSHRVVYNSYTGESFYTADHYNSFVRIQSNWTNGYTFVPH